ncbi:DUF418 domain-containing protein [Glycomyces terrestris]|uniref:DUF418 domain-containing protein n=1 Tax=Glycomyces terrestris TaxID=2493553 RepID=A0A426UYN4_9ACTN|nr:DUF418 domain-containing protein [Glycomyces terrestris]RRR99670.1 DUF418 domain-containing protein [Glycomyces terrestris]
MDTTSATVSAAPDTRPAAAKRLPLLDVLRGAAILGTLGTNIWLFASAHGEAGPLLGFGITEGGFFGSAFQLLANGKFLSMLTVLFGVGLAIQFRSVEKRGRRWPGRYHWRALFLFAEGTVHFVLLFAWDVLMGYAVTAITVAWLLKRSERAQRAVMWTALGLHLAVVALVTAGSALGGVAPEPNPEVQALYASGTWLEQVQFRLNHALVFRVEPIITFPLLVFLFLLGVRLFRAGAFGADDTGRRIRARLMAWGLGLGLPLNAVALLLPDEVLYLERYVIAPVVMLGYIGLIGYLVEHLRRGPVMASLESLGRTALSGYILQNLLASALCYGWGLGLAAKYGDQAWFAPALWLGIGAFLLAGSWLWLRRFSTGPAEALQKAVLR